MVAQARRKCLGVLVMFCDNILKQPRARDFRKVTSHIQTRFEAVLRGHLLVLLPLPLLLLVVVLAVAKCCSSTCMMAGGERAFLRGLEFA